MANNSVISYLAEIGKPLELQIFDNGEPINLNDFTVTNRHPQFATFANGIVTPLYPGSTTLVFESADAKFDVNVLVADPKKLSTERTHKVSGQKTEHTGSVPTRGVDVPTAPASVGITPGSSSVFPLTIANTGNADDTLYLAADVPAGYTVRFFHDTNANGQLDPLEEVEGATASLPVGAGNTAPLLAVVDAPQGAQGGEIKLRVHSRTNLSAKHEISLSAEVSITTTTTQAPAERLYADTVATPGSIEFHWENVDFSKFSNPFNINVATQFQGFGGRILIYDQNATLVKVATPDPAQSSSSTGSLTFTLAQLGLVAGSAYTFKLQDYGGNATSPTASEVFEAPALAPATPDFTLERLTPAVFDDTYGAYQYTYRLYHSALTVGSRHGLHDGGSWVSDLYTATAQDVANGYVDILRTKNAWNSSFAHGLIPGDQSVTIAGRMFVDTINQATVNNDPGFIPDPPYTIAKPVVQPNPVWSGTKWIYQYRVTFAHFKIGQTVYLKEPGGYNPAHAQTAVSKAVDATDISNGYMDIPVAMDPDTGVYYIQAQLNGYQSGYSIVSAYCDPVTAASAPASTTTTTQPPINATLAATMNGDRHTVALSWTGVPNSMTHPTDPATWQWSGWVVRVKQNPTSFSGLAGGRPNGSQNYDLNGTNTAQGLVEFELVPQWWNGDELNYQSTYGNPVATSNAVNYGARLHADNAISPGNIAFFWEGLDTADFFGGNNETIRLSGQQVSVHVREVGTQNWRLVKNFVQPALPNGRTDVTLADLALQDGKNYEFCLRDEMHFYYSVAVSEPFALKLKAPTNLRVLRYEQNPLDVNLVDTYYVWDAVAGAENYVVQVDFTNQYNQAERQTSSPTTSRIGSQSFAPGTQFTVTVWAIRGSEVGPVSTRQITANLVEPLFAGVNLTITPGMNQFTVAHQNLPQTDELGHAINDAYLLREDKGITFGEYQGANWTRTWDGILGGEDLSFTLYARYNGDTYRPVKRITGITITEPAPADRTAVANSINVYGGNEMMYMDFSTVGAIKGPFRARLVDANGNETGFSPVYDGVASTNHTANLSLSAGGMLTDGAQYTPQVRYADDYSGDEWVSGPSFTFYAAQYTTSTTMWNPDPGPGGGGDPFGPPV